LKIYFSVGKIFQPRAAALAAKQKAVCFAAVMLFIYFILEAHIFSLAGRIFVIFVPFNWLAV